jgi:hypothetical protein
MKHLDHIIHSIFPPGTEWTADIEEIPPSCRFLVISDKANYPRWILPWDSALGMHGLQFWWPYELFSQCQWGVVITLYQKGLLKHLPGVTAFGVKIDPMQDWSHMGWQSSQAPIPVIYLGLPMPRSKAVVFLVDSQRKACVQVAKCPVGETAKQKILHEANILKKLSSFTKKIAPDILYQNNEIGIAIQQAVTVQTTPRKLTEEHINWLTNLRQPVSTTLTEHLAMLKRRLSNLPSDLPEKVFDRFSDDREVPAVWIHGDFAPWNFKRTTDGSLIGVDWEESREHGLPYYDLLHFYFIQQKLAHRNGKRMAPLSQKSLVRQYLQAFRLDESWVEKLYGFFLLDYWCRRLEESDQVQADFFYDVSIAQMLRGLL